MAAVLSTLSIISFGIAGVCLLLAVFFWFFFKIPTVINDLTGRTARKSIAQMRAANEKASAKRHGESEGNVSRGKLTGTMHDFGRKKKNCVEPDQQRPETGLLKDNQAEGFAAEVTGLLDDEPTGFLEDEETGALVEETAQLHAEGQNDQQHPDVKQLTMLDEVMLIHTEEEIQ